MDNPLYVKTPYRKLKNLRVFSSDLKKKLNEYGPVKVFCLILLQKIVKQSI